MGHDDWDSDDAATGERHYKSSRPSTLKSSILKNSASKKPSQFSEDDDDDNYNSGRASNRNRYDSPLNSNRSDAVAAYGKPPSGRLPTLSSSRADSKGLNDYSTKSDYGSSSKSDYGGGSSSKNDYSLAKKSNGYDNNTSNIGNYDSFKSKSNLPAITYTPPSKRDTNDSDDSATDRYNKFTKKTSTSFESEKSKAYDRFYEGKTDSKYEGRTSKAESSKLDKFDSKYDSKYDSKFETKYDTYDEDDIKKGIA